MFMLRLLSFVLLCISFSISAQERDTRSTITNIYSYTNYKGNGDIQINVTSPAPNCPGGFYLKPSDPGFFSTLSLLVTAYQANMNVQMSGEDTDIWAGSTTPHCRLVAIGLLR